MALKTYQVIAPIPGMKLEAGDELRIDESAAQPFLEAGSLKRPGAAAAEAEAASEEPAPK